MRIAIVGCGFVADLYAGSLVLHPRLELVGVADRDAKRSEHFGRYHSVHVYPSLNDLLSDERVETVLNLTSPESHYAVTRAALEAGKHVYSEKPLAMNLAEARELCELAKRHRLRLSAAPCSVLSESAQTMWQALRKNKVGTVRLVYAELDDSMLHKMPYDTWRRPSGIPWPYRSEFEVGCTLEHAGYTVTWLTAFFGSARSVTAFSSCQVPDKRPGEAIRSAPDFSVACIRFDSGVVARLTCSVIAPRDHSIRVIGDGGILSVRDSWFYAAPVYLRRWLTIRRRTLLSPIARCLPPLRSPYRSPKRRGAAQMDYLLGVQELCDAIQQGRPSRLSEDFCLHTNEVVLAIHNALETNTPYTPATTFEPMQPMPWASGD
jgi:predicted dehydrogenase